MLEGIITSLTLKIDIGKRPRSKSDFYPVEGNSYSFYFEADGVAFKSPSFFGKNEQIEQHYQRIKKGFENAKLELKND